MVKNYFKTLVIASFIKSLTLSVAGLIDTAVVGRYLGMDGLSAMKLAMPVFSVLTLFSSVLSSGLSVAVSKELAEHGVERANKVFRSAFTLTCIFGVCFMALGVLGPDLLAYVLIGPDCDPVVRAETVQYLRPILLGAVPIMLFDVLGSITLLSGAARSLRIASVVLFAVDIAGDLLVAWLDWGMTGIAAASAAAYTGAFLVLLLRFFGKRSMFKPGFCLPEGRSLRIVLLLGIPVAVRFVCNILRPMGVNRFVMAFGDVPGLAALSIQDSMRYVPGALCGGIARATLILTGMFTAETDLESLRQEKISILQWSCIGGAALAAVLMALSSPIAWIFTENAQVHALGVKALLWYLPGVPFLAINSAIVSMYQGLGERRPSTHHTIFEGLVAPVFFAWILGKRFGNIGIYASFTVSEIFVAVVFAVALLIHKRWKKTVVPAGLANTDILAELRLSISDTEQAVSASKQVSELCLANGVGKKQAFLLALTAEELAMNSLQHGFGDGRKHHLELRSIITADRLILRLRDDGRPFDLTERYKMIDPSDPAHNIGLKMIFASADDVSYNSSMNLNNVCIRINR